MFILEKMGSNKRKGKISVSHGKEMFERETKAGTDGQIARLWDEME